MTARDEAIKALSAARDLLYHEEQDFGPLDDRYVEFMLDAIPPDVLAQLAIESGALVDTTFAEPSGVRSYRGRGPMSRRRWLVFAARLAAAEAVAVWLILRWVP